LVFQKLKVFRHMSRWTRRWLFPLVVTLAMLTTTQAARAGEEDDLQSRIETQRAGVTDIERLDEQRAATDEIALLKTWLDEAWALRAKHEYDQVREVLDRTFAQAELIRQKINASKLRAQADKREAALIETRRKTDQARKALTETTIKKRALEASSK
jgi:hypothetical protein